MPGTEKEAGQKCCVSCCIAAPSLLMQHRSMHTQFLPASPTFSLSKPTLAEAYTIIDGFPTSKSNHLGFSALLFSV